MDVVSDASSVFGGIVITKNTQFWPFPYYHFLNVWEEIIRVNKWLVSEKVALVSTTRVEIS